MPVCAYQVEYAVLKAASEGRLEEIDQVFNTLGQQERVLHAQNEVICTEQHIGIMLSFLTTQLVLLNKHTMLFRCSLIVGLFCSMQFGWSPLHFAVYYGHLNIVNQLVNVCRLPPEQKTKVRKYRWPRSVGMSSTGCIASRTVDSCIE